jgi:hypothetical protein
VLFLVGGDVTYDTKLCHSTAIVDAAAIMIALCWSLAEANYLFTTFKAVMFRQSIPERCAVYDILTSFVLNAFVLSRVNSANIRDLPNMTLAIKVMIEDW